MSERYRERLTRRALLLSVVPFAMACASSGSADPNAVRSGNRDLITEEDLAALPPSDAYQAVERLRPRWLRRRGTSQLAQLRIDGRLIPAGVTTLRTLRSDMIEEMRFIDSRDATTQFGTGFTGGLIDVKTKG